MKLESGRRGAERPGRVDSGRFGSRPFSANKKAAGFLQSPSIFLLALIRGFEAHEIAPAPTILLAVADWQRE